MASEDDLLRWLGMVSRTVTPIEVAVAVADIGADAAGASFANLALLDLDTEWVRVVHGASLDPSIAEHWEEFPLGARTPLCEAMQTGVPVLLGSPEAIADRFPNLLADTLAASLSATASLPLRGASGAMLGAAGFAWSQPQAFQADQLHRLDLIARLAAQALDRARLYERERGQAVGTTPVTDRAGGIAAERPAGRELAVLQLLVVGYTNAETAKLLGVSIRTIESTRARLRERLGLRTRAQLVRYALEVGLTEG